LTNFEEQLNQKTLSFQFSFADQNFQLLPQKAIYWQNEKALILADLHLGKASHFRKQGLAIPAQSSNRDYIVLDSLIAEYEPVKVLILGDLFHSEYNTEWDFFGEFIKKHSQIKFELVMGNHDILSAEKYSSIGLTIHGESLISGNLLFTHYAMKISNENILNFSGHIHPGVRLEGAGRQAITMPCFYRKESNFILPAFGSLTGLKILKKEKNTDIFGVSGDRIFRI
jgi:uncharacterized protein